MQENKKRLVIIALALALLLLLGDLGLNELYKKKADSGQYKWVDVEGTKKKSEDGLLKDDQLLFLLAGIDINTDKVTADKEKTRSDTLMLVKANFETGEITLISLPRDSFVQVNGQYTKLNHAHSYGGIDLTMKTVREWLNLDLNYYVEVNFDAVKTIVDSLGGVDYEIPDNGIEYKVADTKGNWKVLKPGKQKLKGEDALAFLRFRNGYSTGDIGRVKAQQDFLKTFARQFLDQANIKTAPAMVQLMINDVNTNIPFRKLGALLGKLDVFKGADLRTFTLPGDGKYYHSVSYYIPYPNQTNQLIMKELASFCTEVPYDQEEISDLISRFGPMEEEAEEQSAQESQR